MSTVKATFAAVLLSAAMTAPSFAQIAGQLSSVDGDAVVKRAGEYYSAQNVSLLADGDCVTAVEAAARIELVNGCAFDLDANQSVIVNGTSESCEASFTAANGVCAASEFESQDAAIGILPLLIGAAAVTAVVVAVADDDDEPSSP
ncbi:MAG: hypothetical protein AAF311_00845 [Pseudomonadota bacterium]